jgi:ribosomal-protein-alanine N-acetyltransferase
MEHPSQILTAARTYLRPLTAADRDPLITMASASRRFHSPWATAPATAAAFATYLERAASERFVALVLYERTNERLVGVFNLSQIVRGGFQNAYLGYYANAGFARQGLMTEGLRLTLKYGFKILKLHRVEANIRPGNIASIKLVRRCGFKHEGFSPKYLKIGGRWRDHERWAIRTDNWRLTASS